jgi:hypothetical protein
MRLERKKIIDVEGGTKRDCMRILRHETGHVIQNAFRLQPLADGGCVEPEQRSGGVA